MRIGIIGSGNVARELYPRLVSKGDDVMISGRTNSPTATLSHDVKYGKFDEAVLFGDLIVIAIPWENVTSVIKSIPLEYFNGKIIIDVTNAVNFDGELRLIYQSGSAAEVIQGLLPESFVIKALNFIPAGSMVPADTEKTEKTTFIAGDNKSAKHEVEKILFKLGWSQVVDLGSIHQSRYLEAMMLVSASYGKRFKEPFAYLHITK